MGLLRNEIAELEQMLLFKNNHNGTSPATIERKISNLRHNLADAENRFCDLQLDFNKYLAEKIV